MATDEWWKSAVVYQIYPRSFLDTPPAVWVDGGRSYLDAYPDADPTSGDGVGDLEGIRQQLDYLVDLGVDALWLSPIFTSPMADFGYDVADYCGIDPRFGTMADFDRLLADAHDRQLRVLLDWVPNHSSDRHPWFLDARSSRDSAHRDWYVWRDPLIDRAGRGAHESPPGPPPNNWVATFDRGHPAWTWDEPTGQWYLHLFLPEQPDLNWGNRELVDAMHGVLRFWLDKGVDGFRVDVTHCLGKDPALPDDPPEMAGMPHSALNDDPRTHPILRDLRRLLDGYPGERVMVGEVYLLSTAKVAAYYGDGDELHLSFNFPPLYAPWEAAAWRHRVDRVVGELDQRDAWPTWVLSHHDNPRHRTRYGGREDRARAAAVLLLGLRGTPFLYAGEELGLLDAIVAAERVVDPGGRDACRAPIPWTAEAGHGWPADPWLPWPPSPEALNAAVEASDPASVLGLYRRLLARRRDSPALRLGSFTWLPSPEGVLCWLRQHDDDRRVVIVNFTDSPQAAVVDGSWIVSTASDGPAGEGEPYAGSVGAVQALVLRPV